VLIFYLAPRTLKHQTIECCNLVVTEINASLLFSNEVFTFGPNPVLSIEVADVLVHACIYVCVCVCVNVCLCYLKTLTVAKFIRLVLPTDEKVYRVGGMIMTRGTRRTGRTTRYSASIYPQIPHVQFGSELG